MTHASGSRPFSVVVLIVATLILSGSAVSQANLQGQWSTLPYPMPINPVHAALMKNGKVLIVSGSGNDPANFTNFLKAGIWDPVSGTITTQNVSWDMFCNGMVVLPDGRPFINGGTLQYDPFHGESRNAVFDPDTNTFTNVGSMAHGRWYPTPTVLGDGRVMTLSGLTETGGTNTTVEIYKVETGWSAPTPTGWTPPLYPQCISCRVARFFIPDQPLLLECSIRAPAVGAQWEQQGTAEVVHMVRQFCSRFRPRTTMQPK